MKQAKILDTLPEVPGLHSAKRRAYCGRCFNKGIVRIGSQYVNCHCGRTVNATGAALLAKQERLRKRWEEIKEGKW